MNSSDRQIRQNRVDYLIDLFNNLPESIEKKILKECFNYINLSNYINFGDTFPQNSSENILLQIPENFMVTVNNSNVELRSYVGDVISGVIDINSGNNGCSNSIKSI